MENKMKLYNIYRIKDKQKARDCAIKWQHWASKHNLSFFEMVEWTTYFYTLARKFGLVREFRENGII